LVARIVAAAELTPTDLAYVCGLIEEHNGIEYTRCKADEHIARAKELLSIFPDCETRQALYTLADYVVARNK